ncbi:MAG: class I SAM-dependent methyltransferase [Planctomycetales bacterium]|nr:class I SAM-dependent methyltransferase [Planctomycetales bacterium]
METIQSNLYDHPRYYDLVFGSDWKSEFDFLLACFQQHVKGRVKRLFEPACGTGRLLYRLAKAGYQVSGLDLNPKAVAFCNDRLRRHGLPETAFVGDMTDFELPRLADAAFNTINSFRHLRKERQAEDHLRCMAQALRPGGIYVLGLHLTPSVGSPLDEESWSARRGNLCVNTHMWAIDYNRRSRQERFAMTYDVYTPTKQFRIQDEIVFRTYTAKQFDDLVRRTDVFEVVTCYDFAYDASEPIEIDPETEDVVYILKRKG